MQFLKIAFIDYQLTFLQLHSIALLVDSVIGIDKAQQEHSLLYRLSEKKTTTTIE